MNLGLNTAEILGELGSTIRATSSSSIIVYILYALTLYTIAKRRGIKKPWLAWIPFVNVWTLGSISDQYQYVVKGRVENRRKSLLGLNIAIAAIGLIIAIAVAWIFVDLLALFMNTLTDYIEPIIYDYVPNSEDVIETLLQSLQSNIVALIVIAVLALSLSVLAIIRIVFFYIALYDVFRSSDPKNSTLYLVLSLVCGILVQGIYSVFMILCKDKDLGMPPRKSEPQIEAIPAQSAEQTVEAKPEE